MIYLLAGALLVPALGGCLPPIGFISSNPFSMGFYTPMPVPPWTTERMEEKYAYAEDFKTVILPPIRDGFPLPACEDPPDLQMVLRAMIHVKRGVPYFCEEFRDDIELVTELLVDRVDPPRFFPLIGPAQLHHCHWKCIVFYTNTHESGYPFPYKITKRKVEVLYIDKDHLHLVPGPNEAALRSTTRDLSGP